MFRRKRKNIRKINPLDYLKRSGSSKKQEADFFRFPSPYEISQMQDLRFSMANNKDGKFYLGINNADILTEENNGTLEHFAVGGDTVGIKDDRHHITICNTRGHKSDSCIGNILSHQGSLIVYDPKGSLIEATAEARMALFPHGEVHILDPYQIVSGSARKYLSSWNPFSVINSADDTRVIDLASSAADAIIADMGKVNDRFWLLASHSFLEGICAHNATWPAFQENSRRDRNMVMVYELASSDIFAKGPGSLRESMLKNTAANGKVIKAATKFYNMTERMQAAVWATLLSEITFLSYPTVQSSLIDGIRELDISDLTTTDKPKTIYITVPSLKLREAAGFFRLFLSSVLGAAERNPQRHKFQLQTGDCHPLMILIDEFYSLGKNFSLFEESFPLVAGMGVKYNIYLQGMQQLYASCPDSFENILSSAGTLQIYSCSDAQTLKYASDRLGTTLVSNPSYSAPAGKTVLSQGLSGSSYSYRDNQVMSRRELETFLGRSSPGQTQLCFIAGRDPLILQRGRYFKHEAFLPLLHH